jgi:hypothetical protein
MDKPIRKKDLRKQIEARLAAGKSYESAYLEMVALYPNLTKDLIDILKETASLRQHSRIRLWNVLLRLLIGCSLLAKGYPLVLVVGAMEQDIILASLLLAFVIGWCVLDIVCLVGITKFRLKYYRIMEVCACIACAGLLKPAIFSQPPDPVAIFGAVLQLLIVLLCGLIMKRI